MPIPYLPPLVQPLEICFSQPVVHLDSSGLLFSRCALDLPFAFTGLSCHLQSAVPPFPVPHSFSVHLSLLPKHSLD